MDVDGPVALPRGIFTNTSSIYEEVASYSILPSDKLHRYWHAYTVTNKGLKDPTSRRLENFWWHVWGSDRSRLSGRILAKLFKDISLGPTVVPLREPAARWQSSDVTPLTIDQFLAHLQNNTLSNTQHSHAAPDVKDCNTAIPPSDGLHPPLLPQILRESDSLSTNVSRNAARFHPSSDSTDDEDPSRETLSSGSTFARAVDVPATQGMANQTVQLLGRASQTRRSPPSTWKTGATPATSNCREAGNSTCQKKVKRPVLQTREAETSTVLSREQIDVAKQPVRCIQSSTTQEHPREPLTYWLRRSLFTDAVLSTSRVDAQGTVFDQAGNIGNLPPLSTSFYNRGGEKISLEASSNPSILDTRLTPTRPSSSVTLPLGRTKSQLALLLEREKQRSRT